MMRHLLQLAVLLLVDLGRPGSARLESCADGEEAVLEALILGTRDYAAKSGFGEVVLGLSGGIDSALTAAIAAEALGIDYRLVPVGELHAAYERELGPHFGGREPDVTEENIQARIRGAILMAMSNKLGWLLLTTGNKSELAVGYCTLYGDMCGGLAVIADVPKLMVYRLSELVNRRVGREIIPRRTITKVPSAELKPDQSDQDSLPPYELLDEILHRYVEQEEPFERIAAALSGQKGFSEQVLHEVIRMVDRNEYKRKQAPPVLKVTSRAFGFGRRMPIAARY